MYLLICVFTLSCPMVALGDLPMKTHLREEEANQNAPSFVQSNHPKPEYWTNQDSTRQKGYNDGDIQGDIDDLLTRSEHVFEDPVWVEGGGERIHDPKVKGRKVKGQGERKINVAFTSDRRRARRSTESESANGFEDHYYNVLPKNYESTSRPMGKAGEPVNVEIGVWILDIQKISEHDMDLTIEMELLLTWIDERLIPPSNITDDEDFVSLHPSLAKKLWIPDIYFGHIRYMYAPRVFADAQEIWLHKNKSIGISKLLIVKTGCHMNFALYPMDVQRCLLSVESYGYTTDEMTYEWATWAGRVRVLGETTLEQFSFSTVITNLSSKVYGEDTYPRLGVEIVLVRKVAYHLLQTYLPGSLFVMMSWFSFVVPPLIVPGRVVLCVTTILTLTSMFATARTSTPQVSYIKALDVFMITSIIFVFIALLEYTILLRKRRVHLVKTAASERKAKKRRWTNKKVVRPIDNEMDPTTDSIKFVKPTSAFHPPPLPPSARGRVEEEEEEEEESYEEYCARIDRRASVIVPLLFVAFNAVYWPYYVLQRH